MAACRHLYDTSKFRKDHLLYGTENKKVLGKIKDKCSGRPIAEYGGLRPKFTRSLRLAKKHEAKAVKKRVIKSISATKSTGTYKMVWTL